VLVAQAGPNSRAATAALVARRTVGRTALGATAKNGSPIASGIAGSRCTSLSRCTTGSRASFPGRSACTRSATRSRRSRSATRARGSTSGNCPRAARCSAGRRASRQAARADRTCRASRPANARIALVGRRCGFAPTARCEPCGRKSGPSEGHSRFHIFGWYSTRPLAAPRRARPQASGRPSNASSTLVNGREPGGNSS
jgi:hypothetical protein